MRALKIACGIAVILVSLHMVHGIHHFMNEAAPNDLHSPVFIGGVVLAVIVDVLALIGGCLLLRRNS